MNIILTGSSGFVGTKLLPALEKLGHNVIGIDRQESSDSQVNQIKSDLCESHHLLDQLARIPYSIDLLIHCAAAKGDFQLSEEDFSRDNLDATKGILKVTRQLSIQNIVHYSTVSVYGHENDLKSEEAPLNPNNSYGSTKLGSEELMMEWYNEDSENRNLTVLRPSVIYGENNYANMYNLLKQLNSRLPVSIGSGNYVKSMIALENLIDITIFSLERLDGIQVYNCTDEPYDKLKEVMKFISEIEGFNTPKIIIPKSIALLLALPFELLSAITKKDYGITRDRIRKFSTATDYQSQLLRKKGYKQQYSTKERIQNMAKWYLSIKNNKR